AAIIAWLLSANRSPAFQISERHGTVSIDETEANAPICQTGADGRAQVDLGGGDCIRLGANSALRSGRNSSAATLVRGAALFNFHQRNGSVRLEHFGKVAIVTGGIGLAQLAELESGQGPVLVVGALANKLTVAVGG